MLIFLWSFLIIIGFNQNVCQAEDRPHIIFFLADDLGKLVTTHIIHAPFLLNILFHWLKNLKHLKTKSIKENSQQINKQNL